MNVKELINKLKKFPSEYLVIHRKGNFYHEIKKVKLTQTDPKKVRIE